MNDFDALRTIITAAARNESDRRVVIFALQGGPRVFGRQRKAVAYAWLDAAFVLRAHDLPRTIATLVALVGAGRGYPALHARRYMQELLDRGSARDAMAAIGTVAAVAS